MKTAAQIRDRVDRVTSYPVEERERIYRKYFQHPSSTVRFLCTEFGFDTKRVIDTTCHYGYYLAYFGEGSHGLDGNIRYLQFAREMGFDVDLVNIEDGLPDFDEPFDGLVFSGTLEEILSPHVVLMRFRKLLKPDGLLVLRVPTVPPLWFEKLYRLRAKPGYDAQAHLYFFTARLLEMLVERAGYEIVRTVSTGVMMSPYLRPFHRLLLSYAPAATIIARPRPDFKYPVIRILDFLPEWASDLAPYHQDYEPVKDR